MPLAPHPQFDRILRSLRRSLPAVPWKGTCFRVAEQRWSSSNHLFTGEGARLLGGRWNQPGTAAAYASLDPDAAYAEWKAQLQRAGIPLEQKLPAVLSFGDVELQRLLELGPALLRRLRASREQLLAVEWEDENHAGRESLSQALARAALDAGCEALLVPSAVQKALNLVLFPRALAAGSRVEPHGLQPAE